MGEITLCLTCKIPKNDSSTVNKTPKNKIFELLCEDCNEMAKTDYWILYCKECRGYQLEEKVRFISTYKDKLALLPLGSPEHSEMRKTVESLEHTFITCLQTHVVFPILECKQCNKDKLIINRCRFMTESQTTCLQ